MKQKLLENHPLMGESLDVKKEVLRLNILKLGMVPTTIYKEKM